MKDTTLLILAAGMGSRYGGLKQVDPVGPSGETIMDYSIYDAVEAGFTKVVFVVREFFKEEFRKLVMSKYSGSINIEFVTQEINYLPEGIDYNKERTKPWGTAHAVLMAKDVIREPFAVINADDFYGRDSFNVLQRFLSGNSESAGKYSMVGFKIKNTLSESGGVSRGICSEDENHFLTSVEEHHKIAREGDTIAGLDSQGKKVILEPDCPVSMNMWGFTPDFFGNIERAFLDFLEKNGQRLDSEFYIPYVVNEMLKEGKATVEVLKTDSEWFGVTYKEDRPSVVAQLKNLADKGVYPTPVFKL